MVTILLGEDVVSARRAFNRLKADADPDGFGTTILDDLATTVDDVIRAADALPFFGGRRFVGVKGLLHRLIRPVERGRGQGPGREQQLSQLVSYVGRIPATTTLVLWDTTTVKLPGELERTIVEQGEILRFDVPSKPADLQPWLETWLLDRARDQGVALAREASQRLAQSAVANVRAAESAERGERTSTELVRLTNEIDRLSAYVGVGGKVDGRTAATLAPDARAQVFDLVEAVAARATPRALRLLDQTLAEGAEPLVVIRLLDRQISALLHAEASGGTEESIAAGMKTPSWLARKYAQQVRGFGAAGLRRAHAHLLAADQSIKIGRATSDAAVRDLVLALCVNGRRDRQAS